MNLRLTVMAPDVRIELTIFSQILLPQVSDTAVCSTFELISRVAAITEAAAGKVKHFRR